jgi:hypothetical protein
MVRRILWCSRALGATVTREPACRDRRRELGTLSAVPFSISVESTDPYLVVTAAGPATLAELSGLAAFVAELVKNQGHSRVLALLADVEPLLSFCDHLRFGSLIWNLLGGVARVSAVVPAGYVDAPAARAAQLAGVPVRTGA